MALGIIIAIFTSFFLLGEKSFWNDEVFSITFSTAPHLLSRMWNLEYNTWLYFVFLRAATYLGTSEFIIRFPSALFAILTIPFVYKIGQNLYNDSVGKLAAILTSLNVYFVIYAQEARGYSLMLFLTAWSTYLFLLAVRDNKKNLWAYTAISVLSLYAHIFSLLIVLSQFVSLLFIPSQKTIRRFIKPAVCMVIAFIPLILAPSFHSAQINWIPRPHLSNIAGTYFALLGDFIPTFLLACMVIIGFFPWKNMRAWENQFILTILTVPVAATFLFSLLIKPIYQPRFFNILIPAVSILVAACASHIQKRWVYRVVVALIILSSISRLFLLYSKNTNIEMVFPNNYPDWKTADSYIRKNAGAEDGIMFFPYYGKDAYLFYHRLSPPVFVEISSGPYTLNDGFTIPEPNLTTIENAQYPFLWLVLSEQFDNGVNAARHERINIALQKHYTLTESTRYHGIRLNKFKRTL